MIDMRERSLTPNSIMDLSVSSTTMKNTIEKKKEFDRRVSELSREFVQLDLEDKKYITIENIVEFFKHQKIPMNVNLIEKIFGFLDLGNKRTVTKNDYMRTALELDDFIKSKINHSLNSLKEYTNKYEEVQSKLDESRINERVNRYGICEGSILTALVAEAKNLPPKDIGGTSDPYVILSIEGNRLNTKYLKSTLNPVWNETLTFDITSPNSELKIMVMNKEMVGSDDLEGTASVSLEILKDQMKHDIWVPLKGINGEDIPGRGQLRLNLQWIHSNVTYWADLLLKWEENIDSMRQIIEKYKYCLQVLREPFGIIFHFQELPVDDMREENSNPSTPSYNYQIQSSKIRIETNYCEMPLLAWLVYIALSITICMARPDFVNMIVGIIGITILQDERLIEFNKNSYFVIAIVGAIFYDVIWFGLAGIEFTTEATNDVESSLKSLILFLSGINILLKIGLLVWVLNRSFKQGDDLYVPPNAHRVPKIAGTLAPQYAH